VIKKEPPNLIKGGEKETCLVRHMVRRSILKGSELLPLPRKQKVINTYIHM
jgi:hypothetical protein